MGAGNVTARIALWSGALPAVVSAAMAIGFGSASAMRSGSALTAAYMREGHRAFLARDYATARVCFGRLADAPSPPAESIWALAETYEATGEPNRALPLWDRVAPANQSGFAPAQLRRARSLLRTHPTGPITAEYTAAAEKHLSWAVQADPDSIESNSLLGSLLVITGRPGQAAPLLARAADGRPELRMVAAQAYAAAGQRDSSRFMAELAQDEATRALSNTPEDFDARLRLAMAAVFLGDHAKAVTVLRSGLERTGDRRYRTALTDVYVAWSDTEAFQLWSDPARKMLLLEEGLRLDPTSGPLLERFGRVLKTGGRGADRARQALVDLLARGQGGAGAHFILGLDAWVRGETGAARLHLEEAARLDPNGPPVANNLAWVLSHGPDPDLPRSLALAELALERQPGNSQYRGTRGAILARVGRWKDALPDLEAALTTYPKDPEIHKDLSDVYEHLGNPDLAVAHRKLAAGP